MRGAALQLLGAPIHRLQDRSRSRIVRNCGRGDLFLPQIPLSFRHRRMGRSLLYGFRKASGNARTPIAARRDVVEGSGKLDA